MSLPDQSRARPGAIFLRLYRLIARQPWLLSVSTALPRGARRRILGFLVARLAKDHGFERLPSLAGPESVVPAEAADAFPEGAGLNVFGYFRGQFGLGEGARAYVRALLDAGYPLALNDIPIELPHGLDDTSMEGQLQDAAPWDVNLVFVNPDYLAPALEAIGAAKLHGRHTIACWFWELEAVPESWRWAIGEVDEIMVGSTFVQKAFSRFTDKPVLRVPLPITEVADSGATREEFGLARGKFVFLTSLDFNSSFHRKNPLAAVAAFKAAFPKGRDDVQLLIKTSNGHRYPEAFCRLISATCDPRISVRDQVIDRRHVRALQRCVDAYVSLHRAEGFGLGLAECMALGKPVIGTGWSGNLDFMTSANSLLVDYRLLPVGPDEYAHAAGQVWAEPDVTHAAACMRRLIEEPGLASRLGAQAAEDIRQGLSPQLAAKAIIGHLNDLRHRRPHATMTEAGH